ncbi:glycoside hydrolase domain-containing protein [Nocardioides sp. YIM 152588]|uniref:glycoside hydrolase domain-containing protein n=1 Tax=Nocardioides sp. YIM 152588 TaxID=3158259 RepID=UPI0032E3AF7E
MSARSTTPARARLLRPLAGLAALGTTAALALTVLAGPQPTAAPESPTSASPEGLTAALVAAAPNPVTPGDFAGYGFDQCLAPTQSAMDTWLRSSPFLSVGIYISGNSRACRNQPNLTPTWIRTQLRKGWRLLPITLGPQASCATRFPRYSDDPTINPKPGKRDLYRKARAMGRDEAVTAVAEAKRLGIVPGSTLWYDLEGYDSTNRHCRESALAFLSGWTYRLHELDYVSGVYSSAGSGIKDLDDARVSRPKAFELPDMIWVARWDGVANTSTSYIRDDGWRPGGRVKQYQGGHNETWGGVTINIDRNYLDVGNGHAAPADPHCGGVRVNFRTYPGLAAPTDTTTPPKGRVRALQCLLTEQDRYDGKINGLYKAATVKAVTAWQTARGVAATGQVTTKDWMRLHAAGNRPILKIGSTGAEVRRVQRTLNAASGSTRLKADGVYDAELADAVRAYQRRVGTKVSGIVDTRTWRRLAAART